MEASNSVDDEEGAASELSDHSPVPIAIFQAERLSSSSMFTKDPHVSLASHDSPNTDFLAEDLALSSNAKSRASNSPDSDSSDISWVSFCKPLLRSGVSSDYISQTSDVTKAIQSRNFPMTQPSPSTSDAPSPNNTSKLLPFESSQFYPSKMDPTGISLRYYHCLN